MSILVSMSLLAIFGLLMIFLSSTHVGLALKDQQYYFGILQASTILISIIPAALIYFWDYRKIAKLSIPMMAVGIVLLLIIVFANATVKNGSARWLNIGGIEIQPSEFIKPIMIIYMAAWLSKEKTLSSKTALAKQQFIRKLTQFMAILAVILFLILIQPDLGTTLVIAATAMIMFFVSDSHRVHTYGSLALGGVMGLMGGIAGLVAPYRFERVRTFFDLILRGEVADPQGAGYQVYHILLAIGSAGFWGKGFGQGTLCKSLAENTEFTDSTIVCVQEQLGIPALIVIVAIWVFFAYKSFDIAKKAPDKLGQLMAIGIGSWLSLQGILNAAANNGLIPLTGLPSPFLTYGGSSTLVTVLGIGLLLNISKYVTNGKTR